MTSSLILYTIHPQQSTMIPIDDPNKFHSFIPTLTQFYQVTYNTTILNQLTHIYNSTTHSIIYMQLNYHTKTTQSLQTE